MEQDQEIINHIEDVARLKGKINLITIYKNIPLAFEAQATGYEKGVITCKVHKYQLAASVLVKEAFIQVGSFPNCILAHVVRMDPIKLTMGLSEFVDAGNSLNRRMFVRVEPDVSIPVVLFLAQTKARADLADICEGGISVYLDPLYLGTSEKELEKFSARFEVRFQLPGEQYQSVVLQGAIRYGMRDTLSGRYRIGMQLYPTGEARELISRYVKRRQAAALQEIKNIYEKSLAGGKFV